MNIRPPELWVAAILGIGSFLPMILQPQLYLNATNIVATSVTALLLLVFILGGWKLARAIFAAIVVLGGVFMIFAGQPLDVTQAVVTVAQVACAALLFSPRVARWAQV